MTRFSKKNEYFTLINSGLNASLNSSLNRVHFIFFLKLVGLHLHACVIYRMSLNFGFLLEMTDSIDFSFVLYISFMTCSFLFI